MARDAGRALITAQRSTFNAQFSTLNDLFEAEATFGPVTKYLFPVKTPGACMKYLSCLFLTALLMSCGSDLPTAVGPLTNADFAPELNVDLAAMTQPDTQGNRGRIGGSPRVSGCATA